MLDLSFYLASGQNIFIEHRSDLFLPVLEMNRNNLNLYFNNVADDVSVKVLQNLDPLLHKLI